MRYDKTGEWDKVAEKIRYREVGYYDFVGDLVEGNEFQIYKRPYFWGLIGRKKWMWSITTNDYPMGLAFSKELL